MNVQVDLILPDEQRSASAFNLQALLRILSIIGPAILLLLIAMLFLNLFKTNSELSNLDTQWQILKVKKDKADKLRNQISTNQEILEELTGIKNSRIEWSQQLINYMATTPESIQFQKFSAAQNIILNNKKQSARIFKVAITGKAIGDKVDITVAKFTKSLSTNAAFEPYIKLAQVTEYEKDNTLGAQKNDRIFTVECTYKERICE